MTLIPPSILSANLLSLQSEIKALEKAGADRIQDRLYFPPKIMLWPFKP